MIRYVALLLILACSSAPEPERLCNSRLIGESAERILSQWTEITPPLLLGNKHGPRLHMIFEDDPKFMTLTSDLTVQERGVCDCCVTYLFERNGMRSQLHRVNINLHFKREEDALSAAEALTTALAGRNSTIPWVTRDGERVRSRSWDELPGRLAVRSLELRVVPNRDGWMMLLVADRSEVRR